MPCVERTTREGEFVNWVAQQGLAGFPLNSLIVGMPSDDGKMYVAATVTDWEADGHVRSIRSALARFRANGGVLGLRQQTKATTYIRSSYTGYTRGVSAYSGMSLRSSGGS